MPWMGLMGVVVAGLVGMNLADLRLDEKDFEGIRKCRVGNCGLKLSHEFDTLAESFGSLNIGDAELLDYLKRYPQQSRAPVESFVYWSRETLGARPIISITHALLRRGDGVGQPEALIASKRVFATHYVTASLGIMVITRPSFESPHYLVYINRTAVDFIEGFFSGLIRPIVQRRVTAEAPSALHTLRRRLEQGGPDQ
jgi:hypothetical protein